MRGFLLACVCVLLIALPAFAAPIPGTYDGTVRHNWGYHKITTTIDKDGNGTYRIDDGTTGKLTHLRTDPTGEVYHWKDRRGEGVATFLFIKGPDGSAFGGYWGYPDSFSWQRHAWNGGTAKPTKWLAKK